MALPDCCHVWQGHHANVWHRAFIPSGIRVVARDFANYDPALSSIDNWP